MPAHLSAWAIYETFPTAADEMLFVGITSNNHWQRFCDAFGLADLLGDPSLQMNEQRVEAHRRLVPIISGALRGLTISEASRRPKELKISYSRIAKPSDLFDGPQLRHGRCMHELRVRGGRYVRVPGIPLELGQRSMEMRLQPPEAGEHTRDILHEIGIPEKKGAGSGRLISERVVAVS